MIISKNYDSAVVLLHRGWQALSGAVTLLCVAHFLSPVEQGFYYTLASLAALHMALDMGLSAVLVQFAAKEFVHLSWSPDGQLTGTAPGRFLSLVRLSLRWYGWAAVVFLLAYPLGVLFLAGDGAHFDHDWRGPWAMLVCATAVGLVFLPAFALAEGSGNLAEVYLVRLVQGFLGATGVWGVLASGGGLYAVATLPVISALIASVWVLVRRRRLLVQAYVSREVGLDWGREVWPLQWRIAASWLAGYALVLMHVPLLFKTQGPTVAGQMGVTMTIASMLSIMALSWITARIPVMTNAVIRRDWDSLDKIYWSAFRASCLTFLASTLVFIGILEMIEGTRYAERFLSMPQTFGLFIAMAAYHLSALFAAYLRSHLREPFLWPSLIGALLTFLGAVWAAPRWGATGLVTVLVCTNLFYFLPVTLFLWTKLRQSWHAEIQ